MTELMTLEEIGSYLRFTRKTIYRLLKQGDIPAIKIGNKWRFKKTAVDEWLQKYTRMDSASILVISNDDVNSSLFHKIFRRPGCTVTVAVSCDEGIECINHQNFDLVFLDLKTPGTDGTEFLNHLKNACHCLPVNLLTVY